MANNLISRISVLGKATATTFQIEVEISPGPPPVTEMQTVNDITADTNNLEPGMQVVFLDNFGGLVAEQEYYILSEGFLSTNFRVGETKGGSSKTLSDASGLVSFIAARVFDSTGPGILLDSNPDNPPQIDYTDQLNQLKYHIGRLADALETSDSTRVADTIQRYVTLADGEGIHMKGPLDWLGYVSSYKLYVENVGPENVTLEGLIAYKAKIDALPKEF
jgi:hypothetical protein